MSQTTKTLSVQDRVIVDAEKRAAAAFSEHQITVRLDQGVFRSWRCCRPDSWTYGFDVTTTPGNLYVTGDIGDLIVSRTNDMIAWSRSAVESIGYFEEKVPNCIVTRVWDPDRAREWIDEQVRDAIDTVGEKDAPERIEKLNELRRFVDDGEHFFNQQLYDSSLEDGSDWPSLRVYNSNFLWCREAVRWLIGKLDAAAEGR